MAHLFPLDGKGSDPLRGTLMAEMAQLFLLAKTRGAVACEHIAPLHNFTNSVIGYKDTTQGPV